MIIYKAINLINDKIYIGKTTKLLEERKRAHYYNSCSKSKPCDTYFYRAIRKYGWENFYWEIVDTCDTLEKLNELEKYYIQYYQSRIPAIGYNGTTGGDGGCGRIITAEEKKKRSESRKGFRHSEESKRKMSESQKGRKQSEYTKKKISEANKGHIAWNRGKTGSITIEQRKRMIEGMHKKGVWNKGKHMSEESKRRVSESKKGTVAWNKGKPISDEHKKHVSNAIKNKWATDQDYRKRTIEARKFDMRKTVIRNDGVVFSSIKEAAKAIGVSATSVSYILHGKSKQIKGYTFTLE